MQIFFQKDYSAEKSKRVSIYRIISVRILSLFVSINLKQRVFSSERGLCFMLKHPGTYATPFDREKTDIKRRINLISAVM
jgi:hypothetical protein